tara:strand:+ start:770 stop:1654 length:885 start_codon:yes stop_codon:yes gene_type:complete
MSIKKGIYAASLSIFNGNLSLDVDETIKHAEKIIKNGAHGVCLLGSTGFAQYIDLDSKKKLLEKMKGNKFIENFIIGTGSNSLIENVNIMKCAIKNGVSKFLLMPPAYYKYSDEGVYSYYANIIDRVPESEIILYNFEKLSGYKFNIQIIEKLTKNFPKQIIGVKDSSGNLYENLKIPNFMIFPGSETKLLKGLEIGCSGIISAVCNVTAPLARKVFDDFANKKKQTFNDRLCAIREVFDKNNLISSLHSFLSFENNKYKIILPPLTLLSDTEEKNMMSELKKLDFFPEKNIAA